MAAFASILILPFIYSYDEGLSVFLIEVFSVVYFFYVFLSCREKIKIGGKGFIFFALLLTWLFTVGRSVVVSLYQEASFEVFFKLLALVFLCLGFSIQMAFERKSTVNEIFAVSSLAGFVHGAWALNEYIEAPQIPDTWLDPASKDIFRTRCAGIFTDPNVFAAFLSVIFILSIGSLVCSKNSKAKIFTAISLVFCGFGIFSTLSRGAWVAFAAGLIIPFCGAWLGKVYYKFKNFNLSYKEITGLKAIKFDSKLILIVVFAVLTAVFLIMPFKYRIFTITKPSDMTFAQRTYINKGIIVNIKRFPIAGHGLQNFNLVYPQYRIVGGDYPLYCHNEFLQSIIETGFMSAFLMILLCFYASRVLFFSVVSPYKPVTEEDSYKKIYGLLFASSFIVLLVHNLSGFSSRMLPTAVLIALSFGYVFSFGFKYESSFSIQSTPRTGLSYWLKPSKALVIIIVAILAISYLRFCGMFMKRKNMLNEASNAINNGNINLAEKIYKSILSTKQNDSYAAALLGNMYERIGLNDRAIVAYEYAIKITPAEASFYERIAALSEESNAKLSDAMYKKTLELDPAAEYVRISYAEFLLKQGKKEEAEQVLKTGLTYSPGFHNVYKGYSVMEKLLHSCASEAASPSY